MKLVQRALRSCWQYQWSEELRPRCGLDQRIKAGEIIAGPGSRPGPPKGSFLEGKSPAISGKSRLVKYYNLARSKDEDLTPASCWSDF